MLLGLKKLAEPSWSICSNRKKLPVAIFCNKYKSIVIIEKLSFIAVWQNFEDILKTVRKTGVDILSGNIMSPTLYTVPDSPDAFFGGIKTDIVQANIISSFFCTFAKPLGTFTGKCRLLCEIHTVHKICAQGTPSIVACGLGGEECAS